MNWDFSSQKIIIIKNVQLKMCNKWRTTINSFTHRLKFDFTVDEGKERLYRRRKVGKSCATFLLCDPGWYVHKPDMQNKRDDNTHAYFIPIVGVGKERRILFGPW